jgi:hypothetical protein
VSPPMKHGPARARQPTRAGPLRLSRRPHRPQTDHRMAARAVALRSCATRCAKPASSPKLHAGTSEKSATATKSLTEVRRDDKPPEPLGEALRRRISQPRPGRLRAAWRQLAVAILHRQCGHGRRVAQPKCLEPGVALPRRTRSDDRAHRSGPPPCSHRVTTAARSGKPNAK